MDIGIQIKKYLDEIGMSQVALSERTKISVVKLNLSFSGKRRLTFAEYQVICWALDVPVSKFLKPCPPENVA